MKLLGINRDEITLDGIGMLFRDRDGVRRMGLEFDAALGYDFMLFLMSISGWGRVVVIE